MGLGLQNPIIVYDKNGNGMQVSTQDQYNAALAMGYLPAPVQTTKYALMLYGTGPNIDLEYLVGNDSELAAALAAGWSQTPPSFGAGGYISMTATVRALLTAQNAARFPKLS